MYTVSIVDAKNITTTIKKNYQYDFSYYSLNSFRIRLKKILDIHYLKYPDILINRLLEDANFLDVFLKDISVESTEMFRDPGMWIKLRNHFLPELLKFRQKINIWLPRCVSGDELFSISILLKESGLRQRINLYATSISQQAIVQIKKGIFRLSKLETSNENYEKFGGKASVYDYIRIRDNNAFRDPSLIKNVIFKKQNLDFNDSPRELSLILFRNQMLYFTPEYKNKTLTALNDLIIPGGYLILGVKESLQGSEVINQYKLVDSVERIFKKHL